MATRPLTNEERKNLTKEELQKIIGCHHYVIKTRIDAGTFGSVYGGTSPSTGEKVALKVCMKYPEGCDDLDDFTFATGNELMAFQKLKHPNIMNVLSVIDRKDKNLFIFVMPLAEGKDLHDLVEYNQMLPDTQVVLLTRQLLQGLAYMHSQGYAHRDLKAKNILLDGTGTQLKISDFGTTTPITGEFADRACRGVCTVVSRPPEYMLGWKDHDPRQVDVWSLGCVVFYMRFQRYPFFDKVYTVISEGSIESESYSEIGTMFHIFRVLGTPSEATWPGVSSTPNYQSCFPMYPHKRIEDSVDFTGVPQLIEEVMISSLRLIPWHRLTAQELLSNLIQLSDSAVAVDLALAAEENRKRKRV